MKQALKGLPVEQFPEASSTLLAKQGDGTGIDDEAAAQAGETFYPEVGGATGKVPQASSQQFYKNDLE